MSQVIGYDIARASTLQELQTVVQSQVEIGYEPVGGVSVVPISFDRPSEYWYIQPLIYRRKEPN